MFLTTNPKLLGATCHNCGDEEDCVAIRIGEANKPANRQDIDLHLCETCLEELRDALMGLRAAEAACEGSWEYQSHE